MTKQLNVLVLIIDDLRPQLGCYGESWMHTPRIDALASRGLRFDRHYNQFPICAPSRVNIFTGCRPDTTGVLGLRQPLAEAMPDATTLPGHFKAQGYETVSIGKVYHHFRGDDPAGWSREPVMLKGEHEVGRGYVKPENRAEVRDVPDGQGDSRRGLGPAYEWADVDDDAYGDGLHARRAVQEIERLKNGQQPFFLAVGFNTPHLPFSAPKQYWDLYDSDGIPPPTPASPPTDVSPAMLNNFGELRGYLGVPGDNDPLPENLVRTLRHGYAAAISYLDAQVGRVLDALDEQGLRDDTVVIFCVDHGFKLGEHGQWCKHSLFELDCRVPLIVSPPKYEKGGVATSALTENVDIFPALCELAGLPVPETHEATSFTPLLDNPQRVWKTAAFSQFPGPDDVVGYSIRTDRYRYTEWRKQATGEAVDRDLYDHETDPLETVNLAERREHAGLTADLSRQLEAGWRAATPGGKTPP